MKLHDFTRGAAILIALAVLFLVLDHGPALAEWISHQLSRSIVLWPSTP